MLPSLPGCPVLLASKQDHSKRLHQSLQQLNQTLPLFFPLISSKWPAVLTVCWKLYLADIGASQAGKRFYLPFESRDTNRPRNTFQALDPRNGCHRLKHGPCRAKHLEIYFHNMQHPAAKSRLKSNMWSQKKFSGTLWEESVQKKGSPHRPQMCSDICHIFVMQIFTVSSQRSCRYSL